MSGNTYGSHGLRRRRFSDIFGKYVKNDILHLHLIDYWNNCHHPHQKYFWWHKTLMPKLERQIRKKRDKSLTNTEIFFERMKDKDESVNPLRFLEESELYFQSLVISKKKKEELYLPTRNFKAIRQNNVYETVKPIR